MTTQVERAAPEGQRAWWLRALLVLQAPAPVFAALRDDSRDAVEARQEPVTALVFLAGIAGVLLTPAFGRLYDDYEIDALGVVVITIFAGAIYGFFGYWFLGWVLSFGVRKLGGGGGAHRMRHVVAYAVAPLALSLVAIWPVRLAIYGSDVFRSGGADSTTAGEVLKWVNVAFAAWALVLLVLGIQAVERWTWLRAAAAGAIAVALAGAVLAAWAVASGAAWHHYR